MNKEKLRCEMLARNKALPEAERIERDGKIFQSFISMEEYRSSKRVFVYIGVGEEVSTAAITERMFSDGKEVYVPLCHGKGEMDARRIYTTDELNPGRYGIPEPSATAPKVLPEELDLIIVPGVAFGEDGTRLGRGGGYYDRFLSCAGNARKIALSREINIEKTVPCELHDETVDIIVTDTRIIKIR